MQLNINRCVMFEAPVFVNGIICMLGLVNTKSFSLRVDDNNTNHSFKIGAERQEESRNL